LTGPDRPLTLPNIQEQLALRAAARLQGDRLDRAAVALILRDHDGGLEALFIQRAKREGDRWSGQMAFPGGRMEPEDGDSRHTAERETREEVAIDLSLDAIHLGRLDELPAMSRGKTLSMVVTPHVYHLQRPVEVVANEEVDTHVWVPLVPLRRGDYSSELEWKYGPKGFMLPCFQVGPHCIWGLTYRMLFNFLDLVGAPLLQAPPDHS